MYTLKSDKDQLVRTSTGTVVFKLFCLQAPLPTKHIAACTLSTARSWGREEGLPYWQSAVHVGKYRPPEKGFPTLMDRSTC